MIITHLPKNGRGSYGAWMLEQPEWHPFFLFYRVSRLLESLSVLGVAQMTHCVFELSPFLNKIILLIDKKF